MTWFFSVKTVLIIDAIATEHVLHCHGIGKMKHIDVADLWLQDEVKSNKLKIRRIKKQKKTLQTLEQKRSSIKSSENMGHPRSTLVLKRTGRQEMS